jgi:ribose-phosphate pyrophosphokinase
MQLFSLDPQTSFSDALATHLGVPLSPLENRRFEDGEHKVRPLVDPRGHDVYVVHSLYGEARWSPHDKLCQLLMFIATLRDHGATRVTAVVPYLAYARKDRQTKPFDPVTQRYVAQLMEAVGTSQLIVLEVHNVAAFQNAFRCTTVHLPAHHAFEPFVRHLPQEGPLVVASPDPGGVKRAQLWRESLEQSLSQTVGFAMVDKRRSANVVSSEHLVAGDVKNTTVLLIDDLIAGGETMRRAAAALKQAGAHKVVGFAAHGLFTDGAADVLADECISELVVADSVPPFRLAEDASVRNKLTFVSSAPLFAYAITACRAKGST